MRNRPATAPVRPHSCFPAAKFLKKAAHACPHPQAPCWPGAIRCRTRPLKICTGSPHHLAGKYVKAVGWTVAAPLLDLLLLLEFQSDLKIMRFFTWAISEPPGPQEHNEPSPSDNKVTLATVHTAKVSRAPSPGHPGSLMERGDRFSASSHPCPSAPWPPFWSLPPTRDSWL